MKTSKLILGLFITSLVVGCSNDDDNNDPELINPPEVITTMNVTLTPPSGDVVTLKSYDADGEDGPIAPKLTTSGPLKADTAYTGVIELLNETEDPAENTTEEIKKEANDHQFFYREAGGINATFAYADTEKTYVAYEPEDDNGGAPFGDNPVGIAFTMTTGDASTGTVNITLIHLPEKNADGVSGGNIANAGGETDFTATFAIVVE